MGNSTSRADRPSLRLERPPEGLAPWRKWAERSLLRIARAVGLQIQIDGATSSGTGADGSLTFKVAGGGSSSVNGPLYVNADFTVVPGTVNGLTPTIFDDPDDVPISDVPAPVLPITGSSTEHVVIQFFGTLSKSTDDEFVRSVEFTAIKLAVTGTAPSNGDLFSDGSETEGVPQFILLLATFVDGVKTLQAYEQSLWFKPCDDMSRTGTCVLEQTNPPA